MLLQKLKGTQTTANNVQLNPQMFLCLLADSDCGQLFGMKVYTRMKVTQ